MRQATFICVFVVPCQPDRVRQDWVSSRASRTYLSGRNGDHHGESRRSAWRFRATVATSRTRPPHLLAGSRRTTTWPFLCPASAAHPRDTCPEVLRQLNREHPILWSTLERSRSSSSADSCHRGWEGKGERWAARLAWEKDCVHYSLVYTPPPRVPTESETITDAHPAAQNPIESFPEPQHRLAANQDSPGHIPRDASPAVCQAKRLG